MTLNLHPNTDQNVLSVYKEMVDKIRYSQSVARGKVIDSFGNNVWEESEEDYQKRMNELFYEVK